MRQQNAMAKVTVGARHQQIIGKNENVIYAVPRSDAKFYINPVPKKCDRAGRGTALQIFRFGIRGYGYAGAVPLQEFLYYAICPEKNAIAI